MDQETLTTLSQVYFVVNMAYASASGSQSPMPVNADILKMLEDLQSEPMSMESLGTKPEIEADFEGNPVSPDVVMTCGKYKGKEKTFKEIYMTDKNYVAWCRAHLNNESAKTMKQFRVFIAFVDQKKMERMRHKVVGSQRPVAPNAKRAENRGRVREHIEVEETDMEWDVVSQIQKDALAEKWGVMTNKMMEHEAIKKQKRLHVMVNHPQAMTVLSRCMGD